MTQDEKRRLANLVKVNVQLSQKAANTPALALRAVMVEKDKVINEMLAIMARGFING